MAKQDILNKIFELKAVAVVRMNNAEKLKKVIDAIYKGGVAAIEITMTTPGALQSIENLSKTMGNDIVVGVGSAINKQMASDAINAGAKFVVSPIFKKELIEIAHQNDVPAMPGCFTPTEIQTAYEAGADVVKVFPADVVGMAFFKGVLAPLPHLKLMPTGGVSLTNAGDWIKTGACAVGIGSALLDKKAIEEADYNKLTQNAISFVNSINSN